MTDPSIHVAGAGKQYTKYTDTPTLLGRALQLRNRTRRSKMWAIRDATFDVEEGSCIGIIGRNGSGKSTLLRMLAGVTAPTEGRVQVRGRVAPLISVGVGFHPELTGRENVYVNGIVLGRTKAEMDRRFDEILEFSQLESFIDTPVKFYSSGMFVRLGFAVSIMADPSILIVDEVLAVGDLVFQLRCFERMTEIRERGTTVVVVSHNLRAIQRLCARTLVLHDGAVRYDGETSEAIGVYHDLLGETRDLVEDGQWFATGRTVDAAAEVRRLDLATTDGRSTRHVRAGDEVEVTLTVRFIRPVDSPVFGLNVLTESGTIVYANTTPWDGGEQYDAGRIVRFTARFRATLVSGTYSVLMGLMTLSNTLLTPAVRPLLFYVDGADGVKGLADLGATFAEGDGEADDPGGEGAVSLAASTDPPVG